MRSFTTLGLATLVAAASMTAAQAQTQTANATGSLQVNVNGPGTSSKYLNVEGNGTGVNANNVPYATFGVLDFTNLTAPKSATSVSNVSLSITDSPFSATAPGTIDVYLVSNTTANTGLKYDTTTPNGIGTQLGTAYSLGTFQYTGQSTKTTPAPNPPTLYTFNFTPSGAAQSLFLNELNAGTVRLALGADASTPTVVGSFAGAGGGGGGTAFPTLTFTANAGAPVPEASTTASFGLLLILGLGGVAIARRRKQA